MLPSLGEAGIRDTACERSKCGVHQCRGCYDQERLAPFTLSYHRLRAYSFCSLHWCRKLARRTKSALPVSQHIHSRDELGCALDNAMAHEQMEAGISASTGSAQLICSLSSARMWLHPTPQSCLPPYCQGLSACLFLSINVKAWQVIRERSP